MTKDKDLRLFTMIPMRALKDKRFQRYRQALFILAALCSFTDRSGCCYPNQKTIAKLMGRKMTQQAISKYIRLLIDWGYVKRIKKRFFPFQKGNSYFILFDPSKVRSENTALRNAALSETPIKSDEELEREEAQKTIEDTTSGLIASQPAGSKNQTNNQIDITKRNISKRNLMQLFKTSLREIYGKDLQYSNKQEEDAGKLIDEGVEVNEATLEKMRAALRWLRKAEPMKDAPFSINFFRSWLLPGKSKKKTAQQVIATAALRSNFK